MKLNTVTPSATEPHANPQLSAGAFRDLIDAFVNVGLFHGEDHRKAAERKLSAVREMIEHPAMNAIWREHLLVAAQQASQGHHESEVIQFPSTSCTDGGQAINTSDPNWPTTLTGTAVEVYRAWQTELAPRGFQLKARILDYPHGNLGEAGLFLSWEHDAAAS